MSNENRESNDHQAAAPIVIGAVAPWRISKEQLAAAERARLYHVNKLAGCRQTPEPHDAASWPQTHPPGIDPAADVGGAG